MRESKFNELYKKLNLKQREAVDTIEGPVAVVAGPGTGKTQILTLRIANILRTTDVPPDAVLALTFTEAASFQMRKRLVEIIGPAAYRVNIFTFHSFANSIIQEYPDRFSNIIGASNINIIDQIKILQTLIDKTKLKKLKPFGNTYYYLRPALAAIGKLKKENISVKEFGSRVAKSDEKLRELHVLYTLYQDHLRKNFLYDYDDMIMEVITVLGRDKNLLLELQEKYQYILADEHQDANHAQNTLLELLASFYENPNLFIVGDEKQAIFRFQGASLDNFAYFKKKFPSVKVITLTKNYRSEQFILDASHSLIPHNKLFSGKAQALGIQKVSTAQKIGVARYDKVEDEMYAVRGKIEALIQSGVAPREIAVLYRDNKDALPMIWALEKSKVPFVIESDQDILADADIQKLILLLRTIESVSSRELLARTLHIDFLNIDSVELYQYLRNEGASAAIRSVEKQIASWRKTSHNTDLVSFFEILVRESGFLKHILAKDDSVEKMEKLDALFDEIKELVQNHRRTTLADFLGYIDLIEEHNILLKKDKSSAGVDAVRLMTAHRSKGQEFDHVFIIGVSDGHWGGRRDRDLFDFGSSGANGASEERKLFYVALTRARRGVHISYHTHGRDGQSLLPSQFIHEIDPELIEEHVKHRVFDKKEQYKEGKRKGPSLGDKKYLKELFETREFSVTALNNYLECPWKYFYSNLVRIPTAISKHQLYGIAMHAALKEFFATESRTKKHLLHLFEQALKRQPVSESDFDVMREKGQRALSGYFDTYAKSWGQGKVITEMNVKGVPLSSTTSTSSGQARSGQANDVVLTGKLDKVEILKDGRARVVDYKTGKPRSRNAIVKDGYFRQLVFYKLLLDRFDGGKFNMIEGVIDFLEPNERGYYKRESFQITDEDLAALQGEIAKVVKEIRALSFWKKRCDDPKCEYCKLRDMIRK